MLPTIAAQIAPVHLQIGPKTKLRVHKIRTFEYPPADQRISRRSGAEKPPQPVPDRTTVPGQVLLTARPGGD